MHYKRFTVVSLLSASVVLNVALVIHYLYIFPRETSQNTPKMRSENDTREVQGHHEVAKKFGFLSSTIFEKAPDDILINFVDLRESLKKKYPEISKPKTGIYFEYLPTGIHIGINDRQPFLRASLVKLPLAMRAYKLFEDGRIDLSKELTLEERFVDKGFGDLWKRGVGAKLSVEDCIKEMLTKSDNTAFNMLADYVNVSVLKSKGENNEVFVSDVYDYLDIPRLPDGKTLAITPRSYGSVLKSLYFSAYLSKKSSNTLLDFLTQTAFDDLLTKNLPKEIAVAHKYAVYNVEGNDAKVTSDCGIVYLDSRPYVLCVMVEGVPSEAKAIVADVSDTVYAFLAKNK